VLEHNWGFGLELLTLWAQYYAAMMVRLIQMATHWVQLLV